MDHRLAIMLLMAASACAPTQDATGSSAAQRQLQYEQAMRDRALQQQIDQTRAQRIQLERDQAERDRLYREQAIRAESERQMLRQAQADRESKQSKFAPSSPAVEPQFQNVVR